jgi:hypothetical protein
MSPQTTFVETGPQRRNRNTIAERRAKRKLAMMVWPGLD